MKQIGKYVIMREEEAFDIAKAFATIDKKVSIVNRLAIERQCLNTGVTAQDKESVVPMCEIRDIADEWIKRITWRVN